MSYSADQAAPRTFDYLQVCRAVAASIVVLFHIGGAFAAEKYFGEPLFIKLFKFGSSGVEFFFVLSGFIIYYAHRADIGRITTVPSYLRRRAARIYPSYWIVFLSVAAIAYVIPAFREGLPDTPWIFAQSLALTPQDPSVVGGTGAPLIIVAWSMQYELVFYLLFGFCLISPRFGLLAIAALGVWWAVTAAGWSGPDFPLAFMKPHYFAIFIIGGLAAHLCGGRVARPLLWIGAGLAGYLSLAGLEVANMFIYNHVSSPGRPDWLSFAFGFFSGILVVGLVESERRAPKAVPPLLAKLGDASYVLYLVHFPIISAMAKVLTLYDGGLAWVTASVVLVFVVCCIVSVVFHDWIEKPLVKALKGRAKHCPLVAAHV